MFNFKRIPEYFSRFFKPFKKLFSKPQFDNFKRLVTGHILSDRKNIQEISAIYSDKDQSTLNRFVTSSNWNYDKVNVIRVQTANKILGSKRSGVIILDDTVVKKTGKKMEKANYHRSGVTKKKEWGHCFVDSLYAELDSDIMYPIRIDSYLRQVDADEVNLFKTKRKIALEQIDFALKNRIKANTVMADAWYYSTELVQELKSRRLKYFLGVKTSLKISLEREKRIDIKEYLERLSEENFEEFECKNGKYFLHLQEVSIRGVGKEILLVSYKEGDENNIKCYVTNHFGWESGKYINALLKRWNIECLHRDTKQHLGLGEYQVRKYRGMQVVALAILTAYTLLILNKWPSLMQKFRPLKTIGEMCRFAKLIAQKTKYWLKKTFNNRKIAAAILNQHVLVKNAKV